jgi:hypothetical protein
VVVNQTHMIAPDKIGRVRLSSTPKSSASTTAPPSPMTAEVMTNPKERPSRMAQSPFDPLHQNVRQMRKPVIVAARNPARDLRGANLIAGTRGRWAGRGGVCLPHNLPIVDAVVSDHDRLRDQHTVCR